MIIALVALVALLTPLVAAPVAAQDRIADSERLKVEGRWPEALQALRDEVARPRRTNDPTAHITNVRQRLIMTLTDYAWLHGFDDKMDAEVRGVHEQGVRAARGNAVHETTLDNAIAAYYGKTLRAGLAVRYARREVQQSLNTNDGYRIVLAYGNMAAVYTDMGEFALARHYTDQTLAAAKSYFVLGVKPAAVPEWLQYWNALGSFIVVAALRGDLAEVEKLWTIRQPIAGRYWGLNAVSYADAANAFAVAGDHKRGEELFREARALWSRERPKFNANVQRLTDLSMQCAEASLRLRTGDFKTAAVAFERCDQMYTAAGQRDSDASHVMRGAAFEGIGEFERASRAYQIAIDSAERGRRSFSLAERANFFRTVIRRPYWGQVRVSGRLAASSGDAARFFQALHISELVRARQLGELLDPEASRRVSPAGLAAMQKRLRADEIVLAYTVTEQDIVLLAMSVTSTRSFVVPYEPREFRALATSIAADLARPDSPLASLNDRLSRAGKLLLTPVLENLAGKRRITVLTDGLMNVVPFELLSYATEGYRPLYRDFVVVNAPSLLFVEHADRARRGGKAANLFAMADPVYTKTPELANLPKEDTVIAARSSRYLSYFAPLPETRTEVQAIGAMFSGEKVELRVGPAALESEIKKANLAGYQFLHFATHGVIGNEIPGLQEPALVLGSEPGEDGFLTMSEVSGLKLNAEITVLSACNTGSGEYVEGEGVMGMSRAFLGAGSRSVVVSLWPVASLATERLMVAFYRHLRAGADAASALRAAKLEFIEAAKANPVESHPFFWAPFILLGG